MMPADDVGHGRESDHGVSFARAEEGELATDRMPHDRQRRIGRYRSCRRQRSREVSGCGMPPVGATSVFHVGDGPSTLEEVGNERSHEGGGERRSPVPPVDEDYGAAGFSARGPQLDPLIGVVPVAEGAVSLARHAPSTVPGARKSTPLSAESRTTSTGSVTLCNRLKRFASLPPGLTQNSDFAAVSALL